MDTLEISYIGAACGKNKYEPRNKMFMLLLCREYPKLFREKLIQNGNIRPLEGTSLKRPIEESYKKFSKMLENHSANNLVYDKFFSFIKNYQFTEEFMTDKAPLNFRWIGLIKIFFPSAKIIHCFREPKDNCLSLYKNLFEGNLNFCYNENDLATYYNLYSDLMKFWKKLYPQGFLDVQYESLINDQNLEFTKKRTQMLDTSKYRDKDNIFEAKRDNTKENNKNEDISFSLINLYIGSIYCEAIFNMWFNIV